MTCNKMTINYDKTNFSIFSPKHIKIIPATLDSLNFGGRTVKRANYIKYLGIHIDEQLTWKNHIEFLHTKLRQFCGIFYKYRSLIPAPCLKQLYFSLINSSIQYGIEIYANTNATSLDDLKVLNNRILRILQFRNIRTRITLLYSTFNTLPIHLLHKYKLCLLVFNFLNNKDVLPASFKDYFKTNLNVHSHFTRTQSDLHVERFSNSYGRRALHYHVAIIWNSLPVSIKQLISVPSFKKELRLYYATFV